MTDTGHWIVKEGVELSEDAYGFIYEITNTVNGKVYIGKKQCMYKKKKRPLKGKKKNRIHMEESDWKTYTSSSNYLNEDIIKYGKDKFIFKIIKQCYSKWELAYFEIKEQIEREVLLSDRFYNGIMNVRIGRPPKGLKV
jgi:hypothetical protein